MVFFLEGLILGVFSMGLTFLFSFFFSSFIELKVEPEVIYRKKLLLAFIYHIIIFVYCITH